MEPQPFRALGLTLFIFILGLTGWAAPTPPLIFPLPQEMKEPGIDFILDERAAFLVPERPSENDLRLARALAGELAERGGVAILTLRVARLPEERRFLLLGTVENPLIQAALDAAALAAARKLPPEGYLLRVTPERVIVAGRDDAGAFYGMQSLRQLVRRGLQGGAARVVGVQVTDWPHEPFRAVRVYVPGPEHLPFFHRFLRDFVALYKFNKVILEMNAGMRLNRHPELNAGWVEFGRDLNATRRDRPDGPHAQNQDSAHHDAGDGAILEQSDVAALVREAGDQFIEVIPEIPTLTHAYYLLSRHRELAEIQDAEWPDTYCPSNPAIYPLVFDVLDEYIDVMHPRMIHLGHDEWRMPVDVCPRCQGKDTGELYARDVNTLHDYLARKGVKMAIWGDHLLENVRGKGPQRKKSAAGYEYHVPGGLTAERVKAAIPKDILILNWFWKEKDSRAGLVMGEVDDRLLADWGFRQVYGNFEPDIENYGRRSADPSVLGGAASSWAASTEANFGKDLMFDFLGVANLVWSTHWPEMGELAGIVQARMPEVRRNLGGRPLPSQDVDAVTSVSIAGAGNAGAGDTFWGADLMGLANPNPGSGSVALVTLTGSPGSAPMLAPGKPIAIGKDVSSLIFRHGCARPARNVMAYRGIWNFDDTAELLGWYDVVFEDGFVAPVPIRYGVNIREWQAGKNSDEKAYCYGADPVAGAGDGAAPPKRFWSYEWVNPRPGKVIREVRLRGVGPAGGARGGEMPDKDDERNNARGKGLPANAIALVGLSLVEQRTDLELVNARGRASAKE